MVEFDWWHCLCASVFRPILIDGWSQKWVYLCYMYLRNSVADRHIATHCLLRFLFRILYTERSVKQKNQPSFGYTVFISMSHSGSFIHLCGCCKCVPRDLSGERVEDKVSSMFKIIVLSQKKTKKKEVALKHPWLV